MKTRTPPSQRKTKRQEELFVHRDVK